MSTSFDIFPTNKVIPKVHEIMNDSVQLFREFMQREKLIYEIDITIEEKSFDGKEHTKPDFLISNNDFYTVFQINDEGEIYVFYHEFTEIDTEFWEEELQENKNAQNLKDKIHANLKIGYSWNVKRTMGQPSIVSLFYGYLAIAIAILTDGIIFSDDGAWDYSCMPIEGNDFKHEYLMVDKLKDISVKESIERWIDMLRT